LIELALYFLRLGATAFGGPAAHIALMEADCVRRRQWITHERFLDVLGAANLIPGPTSTELAMHIGYARAGWQGLIVAGVCFILPAAILVGVLAAVYVKAGSLPAVHGVLRAVEPVVVVVVAIAVVALARTALRNTMAIVIGGAACVLATMGVNEVVVILLAGAASLMTMWLPRSAAMSLAPLPLTDLFLYFVRAGSMVLGSGYVLVSILHRDLVGHMGVITEGQLLDAIAVGQVTPGPIFTTATFIGYVVAGGPGAVVATAGIFLPAFVFSAISVRVLERVREGARARAFLDGVNAAAVAVIAVVLVRLARHALVDVRTFAIALAALGLIWGLRVNPAWVILAAAAFGLFL